MPVSFAGGADDMPPFDHDAFNDVADMIYNAGGFKHAQIKDPRTRQLIAQTAGTINTAVDAHLPTDVPDTLRCALEENGFIFSGFKTFHAMRELGLSMLTSDGNIKSYDDFKKDVQQIDAHYNTNYLYAEWKHAIGACQMAAKWHEQAKDGDRYDLQYRTAQDPNVREDHRLLHGTTLPLSDPFWDKYYPPNGWGCRCTVVQVRKGKFPLSDPKLAMLRGDNATDTSKLKIFRYNPGKTMKLYPPQHPYYKTPAASQKAIEETARYEYGKVQAKELTAWYKENMPETKAGKFAAQRFDVEMPDEKHIYVTRKFYNEVISKHKDDELYVARLIYARMAHLLLPKATLIRQEPSKDHPDATFDVYQFNGDSKYVIELKVKRNADGLFLHYMRLYKK